jgi:hypothetical protein
MLKQNPCRYCALAYEYKGKHIPSYENKCYECENRKSHNEYLKSQRMFEEGETITSLDELLRQEWVMWYHQTKHIKVIMNNQLGCVLRWLKDGAFKEAIRKEPIKAESEE